METDFKEIHVIGLRLSGPYGGVDSDSRLVLELAKHWADLGVRVTLYTNEAGYQAALQHHLHKVVYCIWPSQAWRRFSPPIHSLIQGVSAFIRARRIKTSGLIYSASDSWTDVLAAQRVRRYNPKARWISTVKSINPWKLFRFATASVVVGQIRRDADYIFAWNEQDRLKFADELKRRAYTLRFGLDKTTLATKKNPRKRYDACFISGVGPLSDWIQLAKVWRHVQMHRPGSKLAILLNGSGTVPYHLKWIFQRKALTESVTWFLNADEETRRRTLRSSRLFIYPVTDVRPLVIGEAMTASLPVLAFDSPIFTLDFTSGRLTVPNSDWASLGNLLIHVLSRRGLYLRLKKETLKTITDRDWHEYASQALDFLRVTV